MFLRCAAGALLAAVCGFVAVGCVTSSTDESETTCAEACEHVEKCIAGAEGTALAEDCTKRCLGNNFGEECRSFIADTTCEQFLATSTIEQNDACFTPCGANATTCVADDKIKSCANNREVTQNCSWVCDLQQKRYTGTCGKTFQGLFTANGMDMCWCTL
jgi:hypothetical protein